MSDLPAPFPEAADHHCPACTILLAADDEQDGFHRRVGTRDERSLVSALLRVQDHAADKVTSFAGSLNFVYIHGAWFGVWVLLNAGLLGGSLKFDVYPFGLLTMIVSLEAIFLSTFVMVSQNRQAGRSDLRSQLDYENNLRAEIWSLHIGQRLGIDPAHVEAIVQQAIAESRAELEG